MIMNTQENTAGTFPSPSPSLRARLRAVIQNFRDAEEFLLNQKSSRSIGAAIAYGDMATQLSKLIAKPDRIEDMQIMLSRIAYPRRGTPDEVADIGKFATEIQAKWTLEDLEVGMDFSEFRSFPANDTPNP